MAEFDFISVLISLIIGLGITNLLSGAGRAFYRRQRNPIDEIPMVLTVATLLILALNWWVTFSWRTETNWTFEKFLGRRSAQSASLCTGAATTDSSPGTSSSRSWPGAFSSRAFS